jgi:hypothetical protein
MNLTDFLIELAENPNLAADFKANPPEVMTNAGLSGADQELMLSGDPQAVRHAVDSEKLGDRIVTIVFVSVTLGHADND